MNLQTTSQEIYTKKYQLKDSNGNLIDQDIDDTFKRVARGLAELETCPTCNGTNREEYEYSLAGKNDVTGYRDCSKCQGENLKDKWYKDFLWALRNGAIPGGRIIANVGADKYRSKVSTINCVMSGLIEDDLEDIYDKVKEAVLTMKSGCVAQGTKVITDKGVVNVEDAVNNKHEYILSYNKKTNKFEKKKILNHLTTIVPQNEQICITSNNTKLKTSIKHPVLRYCNDKLEYDRADNLKIEEALIHYSLDYNRSDSEKELEAWFVGAHLGDGSCYIKQNPINYKYLTNERKYSNNIKYVFKIYGSEKEVIERYRSFFLNNYNSLQKVRETITKRETPVWEYVTSKIGYDDIVNNLLDNQINKKSKTIFIPKWIKENPEKYFIPFLAGLVDTDGYINKQRAAYISVGSKRIIKEIKEILQMFGVSSGYGDYKYDSRELNSNIIKGGTSYRIKIMDYDFVSILEKFMVCEHKKERILSITKKVIGNFNKYYMTNELRNKITSKTNQINHLEKQKLGIYHKRHDKEEVSKRSLDLYDKKFPELSNDISFCKTLRKINSIDRNINEDTTFYDFEVEDNNNYLAGNRGFVVIHNCGIGYNHSTLRPKGSHVFGLGADTSGAVSFMQSFDEAAKRISSAGGRRSAQLGAMDISHPDIVEFITAKKEKGTLRKFNLSVLITDSFMKAVKEDLDWKLYFPMTKNEYELRDDNVQIVWKNWPTHRNYIVDDNGRIACKVYKVIKAKTLYDLIMRNTYEMAEPGVLFENTINRFNNNWYCEYIKSTNPCGEIPLPPYNSCLLLSINLTRFIINPFGFKNTTERKQTDWNPNFDWDKFKKVIRISVRMMDNVVEINGLPLKKQRDELIRKRRRGMGIMGLGSVLTMMKTKYGSSESLKFTEEVFKTIAIESYKEGVNLAKEKGPAPIMEEDFEIDIEMYHNNNNLKDKIDSGQYRIGQTVKGKELFALSKFFDNFPNEMKEQFKTIGCRFTHGVTCAPTGTSALSIGNNCSNGIENSFLHNYKRNIIVENKSTKKQVDVYSYEFLKYRELVDPDAKVDNLPEYFINADDLTPEQHVDVQASAQKWVDNSISKTCNLPEEIDFEKFKKIYEYAFSNGCKGLTTYRPTEAIGTVLVNPDEQSKQKVTFELENGEIITVSGDEEVEYEGQIHKASLLAEALRENQYKRF